ncbi:MAG: NTP transferase domain-containing protein [Verrucomicrobia bacterium]|nr:NTP transferase domain-containing protein [Verrucomicrobiota bacterium]
MRAVILAGGKGTRLRPYTAVLPKPLVPVGDTPILEIILQQLARAGITDVTITVGHLASLIETFFGDGGRFGLSIGYLREETPLNTVGSLALIDDLSEPFLVMNGDVLTDVDFVKLIEFHRAQRAMATIATAAREHQADFGVVRWDGDTRITAFIEKPMSRYHVSMGVYVFSRSVLRHIPAGRPFGFDELMQAMLDAQERVYSYPHEGYWLDLGRPDDYERAIEDFSRMREHFVGVK